jgi:hypothetical protein
MRRKINCGVVHWVTVRNEDTGELLGRAWAFDEMKKARARKFDLDEMPDPYGVQTDVAIETLNPEIESYPAQVKKRL